MLDREFDGLDDWNRKDEHYIHFRNLFRESFLPGKVDLKTKYLAALAINLIGNCEYCITYHTWRAIENGATRDQLLKTADIAVAFGGAKAAAAASTWMREAINTYDPRYLEEYSR
jgi:AhpD family alkylhydroperoxidase